MLSTGPAPNPEFYTIWNYRRHIMLNGLFPQRCAILNECTLNGTLKADSEPKAINELLTDELAMTFAALKKHPKVYWIWNHRRWCLENIPLGSDGEDGDEQGWRKTHWGRELLIVEKMLEADARNCAHTLFLYHSHCSHELQFTHGTIAGMCSQACR